MGTRTARAIDTLTLVIQRSIVLERGFQFLGSGKSGELVKDAA